MVEASDTKFQFHRENPSLCAVTFSWQTGSAVANKERAARACQINNRKRIVCGSQTGYPSDLRARRSKRPPTEAALIRVQILHGRFTHQGGFAVLRCLL